MSSFTVRKSVLIKAPIDKVFATVSDFRQWPKWSPWLICDPACRLNFSEDGRKYAWDGPVCGAGVMTVLSKVPPRTVRCRLTMIKPDHSISEVSFTLEAKDKDTEAVWTMEGSVPLFLFFQKSLIKAAAGMDYQRGLNMLKDFIETGAVPSKLEFPGRKAFPGLRYAAVKTKAAIAELGPKLDEALAKVRSWQRDKGIKQAGPPFSIYHRWDVVRGQTEFTCGYPLPEDVLKPELSPGIEVGSIPICEVESIRHTGAYRHLGNAWAAGMARARAKVVQHSKVVSPFEVYESDPKDTLEAKRVTVVHFPVQ